ncbi:MAG: molybdopterin molybdotransferase MoeA [Acidobacteriia bacterium]|nr:molybdopterin molybdotransferase MoeA [Terriglobia bacterium]
MDLISIEEAYGLVLESLPPPRVERVHFQSALNRVLAEDLVASMDIPPFHRAAMDGYAVRAADVRSVPAALKLVGEVRAGREASAAIDPGQAMAITTGAAVPAGADAVQMLEHAQPAADGRSVTILQPVEPGQNVVPRGLEAATGETVLDAGRMLGPAEIAVLATFGCTQVAVWSRPRVALLATGDELVEVEETPHGGQIRNSNAYSLTAQLRCLGIEPEYLGIAWDQPAELRRKVVEGLARDVIIISGGASVGPYDLVKTIFEELEITILFSRVAVRPGKPTIFARKGDKLVFGLPGNPVSSLVSFENFVRPILGRMCGLPRPDLTRIAGELSSPMKQMPGRTAFLPALVSCEGGEWKVDPLPWRGSGDIIGFSRSNALVIFPGNRDMLARGERVEALLLPDFFLRRR